MSITDVLVEDPDAMTAAEDPHPEPSKLRHWIGVVAPPLAVAALVIGAWYFGTYVLLDAQRRFLLPPPDAVVTNAIFDGESFREIMTATWNTARVAAVGLVIASALGIGIAVAMSQARWVERSLFPWAVVLQTVPILAIVPLIGFWWGFDFRSRVLVCVLIAIFPMITNTLFGLRSAPAGPARPLLAAPGEPLDTAQEARVPGSAAGHLRRPADLCGALGDRCHRRRLLLPPGRSGHRPADRQLPRRARFRAALRRHRGLVAARDRRVRTRRLGRRARRRPLARERPTPAMTEGHREARVMTGGVS